MAAPRKDPRGMVNVVSTAQMQGKLELFGFGEHVGCINPGDLLIICTDFVTENSHRQKVEFKLRLKGEDMHLFTQAAKIAEMIWEDNKHWLKAPVNGERVDTRSLSQIRQSDQISTLKAFLKR